MDKAIIKHSILEQPFIIPMRIRKRLSIQKNVFELNKSQLKRSILRQLPIKKQRRLVDPLVMDSASIKSLLFGRMQSYLIFVSILVSGFIVYIHSSYQIEPCPHNGYGTKNMDQDHTHYDQLNSPTYQYENSPKAKYHLLLLETFISFLLVVITLVGIYFQTITNQTRGLKNQAMNRIIKLVVVLLHPNIWTSEYNFAFHLILIMRLPFLVSYWVKASTYYSNRSFRLTQIYGIKPSQNYMYAVKSIVQEMTIKQVVFVYVIMAFIFSHCLFLGGLGQFKVKPFWTCFQIIIVTLPTVGYGQYQVSNIIQRGIILVAVIVGACLNSLITLIMLKQFQMSTQQMYSYDILRKLNLKLRIQDISREYIVNTMHQLKVSNFNKNQGRSSSRKELDNRFKQEYKFLKSRYTEINTRDLNSMFDHFKDELKDFKVNFQQINNMIYVLLAKFHKLKHHERPIKLKKEHIYKC